MESVGLFQGILSESKLEHGYLLVQLTQLRLLILRQIGSSPDKAFIGFLQQLLLFLIQMEARLILIYGFHPGEKLGI